MDRAGTPRFYGCVRGYVIYHEYIVMWLEDNFPGDTSTIALVSM